ncbi:hypothetical protein [Streptomyces sp. NPDC058964]|uniref:hypothetical protein n=1 Tax=Streptomyces sp. NPDC058964 TaxID=3346681 RepID=UPI003679F1B2
MSAKRILGPAAALVLGSLALVACDPSGSSASPASESTGRPSAASGTAHAPAASSASQGSAGAATTTPAARRSSGTSGSGTSGSGTSGSGTSGSGTSGSGTSGSGTSGSATGSHRVGYCRANQLTVTAAPVSRPLNHLLITARNTSGARCNLGIIGLVTFDGKISARTPGGIGGGPNVLAPGQSNYEGVSLDQQDAPGRGADVSSLTVKLEGGDTVRIPVTAHVHAPSVTVWEPTAADALVS